MLNKLKIGPKLIGGFVIVVLITAFIGIFGIQKMGQIDAADTLLYEKATLPIGFIGQINSRFQQIRVNLERAIASNDAKAIDGFVNSIEEHNKILEENIVAYKSTLIDAEDEKLYEALLEKNNKLDEYVLKTLTLAKANKDAEAYEYLHEEAEGFRKDLQEHIEKMVDLNISMAKTISDNNTKTYTGSRNVMLAILIAGIVLSLLLGFFLTFSITRPLTKGVQMMQEMAKGHLGMRLKMDRQDEIGVLANAMDEFSEDLQQNIIGTMKKISNGDLNITIQPKDNHDEISPALKQTIEALRGLIIEDGGVVLQSAAAKDLSKRLKRDYMGDYLIMKDNINKVVENLDQALQQVGSGTEQVSSASQQISAGSQSLAQGANEQASSLEEVSSSLEEMSSMTKQNAENANQAKLLAGEANSNAAQGKQAMLRMSDAINKIKDSSDQTAKIVKTIDEIAMQTNLLALNAAVEAARAGEAGRGFAVVAEEVRNLAQRSAQAAKNTADMIAESVKNSEDGVKIAFDVSKSFEAIATGNAKVDNLIAEIAAASQEQSQGIDQVNTAVAQMDKVTQQNAASSEESASAAEELSSQAGELQNMVAQFTLTSTGQKSIVKSVAHHTTMSQQVAMVSEHKNGKRKNGGNGNGHHPVISVKPSQLIPLEESALKEF